MVEVSSITPRCISEISGTEILEQCPNTTTSSIQTCILLFPVSEVVVFYFTIIMDITMSFVFSLVGIVLNILILIILSDYGFKDTTTILLLSMTVADLMLSKLTLVKHITRVVPFIVPAAAGFLDAVVTIFINNFRDIMAIIKLWHVLLIAIERFLAVSFPFHVARIWTKSRVKCWVSVIYFVVFCIGSFFFFLYQLTWRDDVNHNYSVASVTLSRLFVENYKTIYVVYFIAICHFVSSVPMVVIFLSCAVVIWRLFVRSRYLRKLSASKNSLIYVQKVRPFKVLLAVCLVTVAICLPTNIWYAINASLDTTYCISREATNLFFTINYFSFLVGAVSNFFIYITMQSKFARKFKSIFSCVKLSKGEELNDQI